MRRQGAMRRQGLCRHNASSGGNSSSGNVSLQCVVSVSAKRQTQATGALYILFTFLKYHILHTSFNSINF